MFFLEFSGSNINGEQNAFHRFYRWIHQDDVSIQRSYIEGEFEVLTYDFKRKDDVSKVGIMPTHWIYLFHHSEESFEATYIKGGDTQRCLMELCRELKMGRVLPCLNHRT